MFMRIQPFGPPPPPPHPGAFEDFRQAMIRRFQTYIALGEKHFAHLLLIVTC